MLLLSVVSAFTFFSWSKSDVKSVDHLVSSYIKTVGSHKFSEELTTQSFKPFLKNDKKIFSSCKKSQCEVKVTSSKMKHNSSLWMVKVEVLQKDKKITARQGCYFAKKIKNIYKMHSYVEDCDGR